MDAATADTLASAPAAKRPRSLPRRLFAALRNALALFGLLILIYLAFFRVSRIASGSMSPTLKGDGGAGSDWILTERFTCLFRAPRRWEVMHYEHEGVLVAKRIVALPGETLAISRQGQISIDGRNIEKPPALAGITYLPVGNIFPGKSAACGQGCFMLGDDSRDSYDSRFTGPIEPERFQGRVFMRVWPLSRIGLVTP